MLHLHDERHSRCILPPGEVVAVYHPEERDIGAIQMLGGGRRRQLLAATGFKQPTNPMTKELRATLIEHASAKAVVVRASVLSNDVPKLEEAGIKTERLKALRQV